MMPRRSLVAIVVLVLGFALSEIEGGYAQETVNLSGSIVNGTVGAALPEGIQVLMLVTGADGKTVTTAQTVTGDDGRFEFTDLPSLPNGRYALGANHSGTLYTLGLSLADLSGDVALMVYETTTDASVIRVTHHLTVLADVDPTEREITFIDFVTLANESDRTLQPDLSVPAQMSFLRFSLPPMAETLGMQSGLPGGEIVSVGTGFAVTSQVPPGQHNMEFSYKMPYQGSSITFRQAFHQGAGIFQVLAPERFSGLEVSPLERVTSPNLDGTLYDAWEARDLGRSEELMVTLSGLPQPGLALRVEKWVANGVFWQVAIPSMLGLVLAVLLLWGGLRPSRNQPLPAQPAPPAMVDQENIVREIALLDERFRRGDMEESLYHAVRDTLKGRILVPEDHSGQRPATHVTDKTGE